MNPKPPLAAASGGTSGNRRQPGASNRKAHNDCWQARIAGTAYRFHLYQYDGTSYAPIEQEAVNTSLPVLFKPLGTPLPASDYIASDADFVDYITELMGGFAIPSFVKRMRQGRQKHAWPSSATKTWQTAISSSATTR